LQLELQWVELPAGSLDEGEEPAVAAARECAEEIGLVPGRVEFLGAWYPTPGFCTEVMDYYRVTGLHPPDPGGPQVHKDEDEDIRVRVFSVDEARAILHRHKVEKLLVVDQDYSLKGLITVKDIQKLVKYPSACKDSLGRLRVGAAVGVARDTVDRAAALVAAHVDVLVVDTAHGHSSRVVAAVKRLRAEFLRDLSRLGSEAELQAVRDRYLGRKSGALAALMNSCGSETVRFTFPGLRPTSLKRALMVSEMKARSSRWSP
jgi:ADP-ribose pyrophosphatase YjhB (NUDIX family)